MSNSAELILRRMVIYMQDVEQILYHEMLTSDELASLYNQLVEIEKLNQKIRKLADKQHFYPGEVNAT